MQVFVITTIAIQFSQDFNFAIQLQYNSYNVLSHPIQFQYSSGPTEVEIQEEKLVFEAVRLNVNYFFWDQINVSCHARLEIDIFLPDHQLIPIQFQTS
jgi:hypothetical protein